MKKVIINNLKSIDNQSLSLAISDDKITEVSQQNLISDDATVIDGQQKICIPSFINCHTHAAMTIFKGFADDMTFKEGWEDRVWPAEKIMTPEDCYWGAKLASFEMLSTGTTAINDMYWHFPALLNAFTETDFTAHLSLGPILPRLFPDLDYKKIIKHNLESIKNSNGKLQGALTPHATYSVSREDLEWVAQFAKDHNLLVHTHLSENQWEVEQCMREHDGLRPAQLLHKTGILDGRTVLAHGVWLDESEYELLGDHNATIAHCPTSNMKLCSGGNQKQSFSFELVKKYGVNTTIATDGSVSNNNLDLFEEIKIAALLAKHQSGNPKCLTATEALKMVTENAAQALGLNKGKLKIGYDADFLLINTDNLFGRPQLNIASNLVYALNSSCIDTVVKNGEFFTRTKLMKNAYEAAQKVDATSTRLNNAFQN